MKTFFCGPESFTPDMAPILGEAPELRGYFVAAGLNSIGILTGGGVGRAMAHWIVHGRPDVDVTQVQRACAAVGVLSPAGSCGACGSQYNIDRLHKYQGNPDYRGARVVETLGRV